MRKRRYRGIDDDEKRKYVQKWRLPEGLDNKTAIYCVKSPMQCDTLHKSICLASYYFIVQQAKIQFSDRLLDNLMKGFEFS